MPAGKRLKNAASFLEEGIGSLLTHLYKTRRTAAARHLEGLLLEICRLCILFLVSVDFAQLPQSGQPLGLSTFAGLTDQDAFILGHLEGCVGSHCFGRSALNGVEPMSEGKLCD